MDTFIGKLSKHLLANHKDQFCELSLVFPNKRAALYLRNQLVADAKTAMWLPEMLSIEEAFCTWSGIQKADLLSTTLELLDIHFSEQLSTSTDFNRFISYAAQMSRDFDELDHCLVNSQQLFSFLSEVKALEIWHPEGGGLSIYEQNYLAFFQSLNSFYERLRSRMFSRNMGSYGMICSFLAQKSDEELQSLAGKGKLIFAGFNAFTPAEEMVVKKLVKSGKASMVWDLDTYYTDPNQFGLHEAGQSVRKFLKNIQLPADNWKDDSLITRKKTIHILGVPGNIGQAKALGHQLSMASAIEQTAVVLADEKLLIPVLNSIPSNVDTFNVTMGYPFIYSSIYQLLTNLFEIARLSDKEASDRIPSALVMDAVQQLIAISPQNTKPHQILQKLIAQLVKSGSPFMSLSRIENLTNEESSLIQPLLFKIFRLTEKNSSELLTELMAILQLVYTSFGMEQGSLIQHQLSEAFSLLNRMDQLMSDKYHLLGKDDIGISFRQLSANCSVGFYGEPLQGLQVMGMLETRNLSFESVHLLSVNEGLLPAEKSQQSLIPFDIRKTFGMPVYTDRQAIAAHHFFRLLQHTNTMYLYYNSEADELGGGEPSRYILQIKHELARLNPQLEIKESLFVQPLKASSADREIIVKKTSEILAQIRQKAEKGFSPTSLSRFIECPLKFYLHDIAGIKENEKTDFTIAANVLGSVIHKCLENLYKPYLNQIVDKQSIEEMLQRLHNEILMAFQTELPDNHFNEGRSRIALDMAHRMVQQFLLFEMEMAKNTQTSIFLHELEKNIEAFIHVMGIDVKLHGIIDRVDSINGTMRIIDYKTGATYKKDVKIDDWAQLGTTEKAKALQLSVYRYMWTKNQINTDNQSVISGIFSLRKISEGLMTTHYTMNPDAEDINLQTEFVIRNILENILNPEIPVGQTKDKDICQRCPYASLCMRN